MAFRRLCRPRQSGGFGARKAGSGRSWRRGRPRRPGWRWRRCVSASRAAVFRAAGDLAAEAAAGAGPAARGAADCFGRQVNRVRFTVFDRYTNSAFDAKPFSITGAHSPKIGAYDERVGGTVGGPLKIPHIYNGSDKTYFFVNYQHEIAKNPVNTFSTVPTRGRARRSFLRRLHDLSAVHDDPVSVAGTGCQQIPTSEFAINPAVQGLLGFIPLPNLPSATGHRTIFCNPLRRSIATS